MECVKLATAFESCAEFTLESGSIVGTLVAYIVMFESQYATVEAEEVSLFCV
jgi:hypothetical protein